MPHNKIAYNIFIFPIPGHLSGCPKLEGQYWPSPSYSRTQSTYLLLFINDKLLEIALARIWV